MTTLRPQRRELEPTSTGEVLAATFRDQEDAQGYLWVLREIALRHGLPVAVYSDPRLLAAGRGPHRTPLPDLPGSSPRGALARRPNRSRGANAFLVDFLICYTTRFAQAAANPTSAFRPWPADLDPAAVLCFKYVRIVAHDNTGTLGPHQVQILAGAQAAELCESPGRGPRAPGRHRGRHPPGAAPGPRRAHPRPVDPHPGAGPPPREAEGPQPIQNIRVRKRKEGGRAATAKPSPNHPWRHMPVGKAKPKGGRVRTNSLNG